jgi:hypothetical protein
MSVLPPSMQRLVNMPRMPVGGAVQTMNRLPASAFGFISDFEGGTSGTGTVYVINSSGHVITQLAGTTNPQGMSVANSPRPTLYVANSGADDILKYTSAGAPATLSNGGVEPSDVAVDGAGNVAAMNIQTGTVNCFNGGATSPTSTISGGGFSEVFFGAFDNSGNLFVDGFSSNGSVLIGEIVGGCSTGSTITPLTQSGFSLAFPGGIRIRVSNGNVQIYILDQEGRVILCLVLSGSTLTEMSSTSLPGSGDPVTFTFAPGFREILVADAENIDGQVYSFPAGTLLESISLPNAALPIGTAIYPSVQY